MWGRLEPMLGYLSAEQKSKVLEGLNLAFDSHSGQVCLHPQSMCFVCHLGPAMSCSHSTWAEPSSEEELAMRFLQAKDDWRIGTLQVCRQLVLMLLRA